MEHADWFKHITRNDSHREVARRADLNNRTLANQVNAGDLKPEVVIKIAQAYDESPIVALIDLGYISAKWMTQLGTRTSLSRASDEELTDELLRRLQLLSDEPADDLAKKRMSGATDIDDGTVRDFDYAPEEYAADSSIDETEARLERGEDIID